MLQGFLADRAYVDITGVPEMETACWLSLTGVAVLALGMKLGSVRHSPKGKRLDPSQLLKVQSSRLFIAYILTSILAFLAGLVGYISTSPNSIDCSAGDLEMGSYFADFLPVDHHWNRGRNGHLYSFI